jgi:chromosome condensin MukBEF ATPase and DNA-binding subunit MukB
LFQLYSHQAITINQFQDKNERLIVEQQTLRVQIDQLESKIETEKDTEQLLHDFRQQIKSIADLNIDDERVLKPVIQSLIHKIEIGVDG